MGVQINETWGYDCPTRIDFADGSTADFTDCYTESPFTPMSALNLGEPVPSMTIPFLIMRSSNIFPPRRHKCSNFAELGEHTSATGVP